MHVVGERTLSSRKSNRRLFQALVWRASKACQDLYNKKGNTRKNSNNSMCELTNGFAWYIFGSWFVEDHLCPFRKILFDQQLRRQLGKRRLVQWSVVIWSGTILSAAVRSHLVSCWRLRLDWSDGGRATSFESSRCWCRRCCCCSVLFTCSVPIDEQLLFFQYGGRCLPSQAWLGKPWLEEQKASSEWRQIARCHWIDICYKYWW